MTNPTTSEDRLNRIEELLSGLAERQSTTQQQVDTTQQQVDTTQQQVDKLVAESEKWDERFFQLSRDTLNFSRNVIVTAAVVAVLVPVLREAVVTLIEVFKP